VTDLNDEGYRAETEAMEAAGFHGEVSPEDLLWAVLLDADAVERPEVVVPTPAPEHLRISCGCVGRWRGLIGFPWWPNKDPASVQVETVELRRHEMRNGRMRRYYWAGRCRGCGDIYLATPLPPERVDETA